MSQTALAREPLPSPADARQAYRSRAHRAGRKLVADVEAILPSIESRRAGTEAANRVLDGSIADMIEAGVFRAVTPLQWGGLEVDPASFFESIIKIASACTSTGWVGGQLNVHSWQIALMDERMQAEFWADGPDTRASSAYAPTGNVRSVDGGFLLSGRWNFSSGVDHSDWAILGGMVRDSADCAPESRSFVVPKRDFVIDHDSWDVAGLKGTGSKSITLDNAFVPDYRTHRVVDEYADTNPGYLVNDRPLYRVGRMAIFWSTICCSAIGTATAGLRSFVQDAKTRVSRLGTGAPVVANPYMHLRLANALSSVDHVQRRLLARWNHMFDVVCQGEETSRLERCQSRFEAADANAACFEAFSQIYAISGAAAATMSNPMQLYFRDLMAMRNHGTAAREQCASIYVQTLLDIPPPPFNPADPHSLLYYA